MFSQYAPIYVKKHLISNLTAKIKVLKILAAKSKIHKYTIIRSIDKILPGAINKPLLEYIGVTLDEYKTINPESELFKIAPTTTQCSKIRKKVQFQKCKNALFALSKMAKNQFFFALEKSLKLPKKNFFQSENCIIGSLKLFSGAKIDFFCLF